MAKEKLGWESKYTLEDLVKEMVSVDREAARKEAFYKNEGSNKRLNVGYLLLLIKLDAKF